MKEWWKRGIFAVGGWHPLAARLRRSANQSEELEGQYIWNHSQDRVKYLAASGVDLVMSQFDRGLGESDAATEHKHAGELAALCHAHSIKHGSYLANTIYFESMLKDYPECADWAIRNTCGRFANYGGEQTFRWVACFNSPAWRERMKRIIRKAVLEVKTDLLHFDNLAVWPEPDSCHCHWCEEKFRAFLCRRYPSSQEQIARFGFTGFATFQIPRFYMNFQPAWSFDRFVNPLIQDFIDFRCETVTEYIHDLGTYARSLNPALVLDSNGQLISGANKAFLYGTDAEEQLAEVEIACDENPDGRPDNTPDAVPEAIRKFRGMKQARQLGKLVFTAFKDANELAFNLAFCGSPGIYTGWGYAEENQQEQSPLPDEIKMLLNFFNKHRNLFGLKPPVARVAVWRGRQSLRYISSDTHLATMIIEQLLFNRKIPFTIVGDRDIDTCDLLIVPNVEYLSNAAEAQIVEMVRRGKSVLITGKSGCFNAEGRKRSKPAFSELFGFQRPAAFEKETAVFDPALQFHEPLSSESSPVYAEFGQGRAVLLPLLRYRHTPGEFASNYNIHYNGIDSRYWKEPYNAEEVIDALNWLCPEITEIKVFGGEKVYIETLPGCCVIFRADGNTPLDLRLRIPGVKECQLLLPEATAMISPVKSPNSDFRLPDVRRLAIVIYN